MNLLSRVIAETSLLLPAPADLASGRRIENLVRANAWVDAVLVLIDVELPQWKCRRLLYDERNWNCSLSRFPDLPIELDDTADGQHEALSPAILLAFVEACRVTITKRESDKFTVGQVPAVAAQRRGPPFDRARDRCQPRDSPALVEPVRSDVRSRDQATRVARMRAYPQWRWHFDEVFVKINGELRYLWRAVDHEGEVLDTVVTAKRDKAAALKFSRAMKHHGRPRAVVTDGLRSYRAAMKEIGNADRQEVGRRLNNRAENSHQPFDCENELCSGPEARRAAKIQRNSCSGPQPFQPGMATVQSVPILSDALAILAWPARRPTSSVTRCIALSRQ